MDLEGWLLEYRHICDELGIDPVKDQRATELAEQLAQGRKLSLDLLKPLIGGKPVIVFGAGPSLEDGLRSFKKADHILIAADGAVSALLQNGIVPEINVTDLDGDIGDILRANQLGTITVVHAHGDNMEKLKEIVPKIRGKLVLTTQTRPTSNVKDFFGFTDGDRCVALAKHFGASAIRLIGFDFGEEVGRFSNPERPYIHKANERKKKKLEIAERLVRRFLD